MPGTESKGNSLKHLGGFKDMGQDEITQIVNCTERR